MKVFAPSLLLCVLLAASGCSERPASTTANRAKAIMVKDPGDAMVERTDAMRRRMERLANMTEAERQYMISHPDQLRETENQACAPGNPC